MNRRHLLPPLALLALALLLPPSPLRAAETAETILIRQALERDRSGRRRGDADLVMSAYDEDRFVHYDAGGSIDPRAWSVRHAARGDVETALEQELATKRFDIERAVLLINVWKDKAFVTTLDTGRVVDVATGARTAHTDQRLWTFRKRDEEWLATGVISALGDTADAPAAGRIADESVAAAVRDIAGEWSGDSPSGVAGTLTEEAVLVDGYFSSNPAKWLIIFADREETEEWLDERFAAVDYTVQSTVLHAVSRGDEAIAVSDETVRADYAAGDGSLEQQRRNIWLLTRSGGSWRVAWCWWKSKPFDNSTALR